MIHTLTPGGSNIGQRADIYVAESIENISRSQVKKLFDKKAITIKGKPMKASDKVSNNEIDVEIDESVAVAIDIPVIYRDDDVIVINKPTGMLSHSKGPSDNSDFTVADFIAPDVIELESNRAGIVHRLDRLTSGLMITARHDQARTFLQKQFERRTAKKQYLAILDLPLEPPQQRFEWPIERNPKKPSIFRVGQQGKTAATVAEMQYQNSIGHVALLKLETGRTHQLRVHLSHANRPIIGDTLYGGRKYKRMMLHAWKLQITVPSGENHVFESEMPPEFAQ